MIIKMKKILKMLYIIFVIFILINIFMSTLSYASGGGSSTTYNVQAKPVHKTIATIAKTAIAVTQVAVSGFYIIRFSIVGIQYFTTVAASEKAACKNRMMWTLLFGVLTYLGMFAIGKVLGL